MTYTPMKLEIGDRVGRVTIIGPTLTKRGKTSYSPCRCDCGKEWLASRSGIREGRITSCGCWRNEKTAERMTTHGMRPRGKPIPEYNAWASMVQRCTNSEAQNYRHYGARGITICEAWLSFENFFADMGLRPKGTSIERVDNEKGYEPGNCKWATKAEQMRNKRNNQLVEFNGERLCVRDAAKKAGVKEGRVYWRIHKHAMSAQDAFDEVIRQKMA